VFFYQGAEHGADVFAINPCALLDIALCGRGGVGAWIGNGGQVYGNA
jgi:hypothetical protein